jgi:hypothetical protein
VTAVLRRLLLICLVALISGACVGSATAAEPSTPPAVPFGFDVPATNGWTAKVIGGMSPETGQGAVQIIFDRRGEDVIYATRRVTFSESTVTADFGALGRIEVHPVPTGGTITDRSSCGGKPVTFPAGRWEGTIVFHGEEGFTTVEASSGPVDISSELNLLCFGELDEGIGGHSPGALLTLKRRRGDESLELTVRKNRRVGPSRFAVDLSESRGWLFVDRSVRAEGGSGTFDFAIPPGRARVRPPKPFSGRLSFVRGTGSSPQVTGDLSVDFPGHADVPVLGAGKTRISLERAVLNPSHPF